MRRWKLFWVILSQFPHKCTLKRDIYPHYIDFCIHKNMSVWLLFQWDSPEQKGRTPRGMRRLFAWALSAADVKAGVCSLIDILIDNNHSRISVWVTDKLDLFQLKWPHKQIAVRVRGCFSVISIRRWNFNTWFRPHRRFGGSRLLMHSCFSDFPHFIIIDALERLDPMWFLARHIRLVQSLFHVEQK